MKDWSIIPHSNSPHLRQGKLDALTGKPLGPRGSLRGANEEQEHLYRMGYIAATVQKAQHPDWTDEFILW